MGVSVATSADYAELMQSLRPRGPAWVPGDGLDLASADEMTRIHNRALLMLSEADPRGAFEMLGDWERATGLPDSCSSTMATTLQERRDAVVSRITALGGASRAYFLALAEGLGYAVEIDEYRPFITGQSRCGDLLNGGHAVRYNWRVRVTGPRYTAFRAGVSQCGDLLGKIARADDLECTLQRLKPAHTNLIVSYEGA